MKKRKRSAHFKFAQRSPAFGCNVEWRIEATEGGIVATRDVDSRRVSIDWRTLIGAAMFYGSDSDMAGDVDVVRGKKR